MDNLFDVSYPSWGFTFELKPWELLKESTIRNLLATAFSKGLSINRKSILWMLIAQLQPG